MNPAASCYSGMIETFPNVVTKQERADSKSQMAFCVWFTGLSGAGKTTLATKLDRLLFEEGRHTFVLDGDQCRLGLCKDLDFTSIGRMENVRRVAETAKLMVDAGLVVLVSLISPSVSQRATARRLFEANRFVEVFVNTPLSVCERRDPKGLYQKARSGLIQDFTGISSQYETPECPELVVDGEVDPDELVLLIRRYMSDRGLLPLC